MSNFVVIKYYEDNATNAKIIASPYEYFSKGITRKKMTNLLNEDDKWLAKLNPIKEIEYYDSTQDK
jgi:hypothetical protein